MKAVLQVWQALASAVSTLDVLSSFVDFAAAAPGPTCMPSFVLASSPDEPPVFSVQSMWHPALAHAMGTMPVPNDLQLGACITETGDAASSAPSLLLTGPNMVCAEEAWLLQSRPTSGPCCARLCARVFCAMLVTY